MSYIKNYITSMSTYLLFFSLYQIFADKKTAPTSTWYAGISSEAKNIPELAIILGVKGGFEIGAILCLLILFSWPDIWTIAGLIVQLIVYLLIAHFLFAKWVKRDSRNSWTWL